MILKFKRFRVVVGPDAHDTNRAVGPEAVFDGRIPSVDVCGNQAPILRTGVGPDSAYWGGARPLSTQLLRNCGCRLFVRSWGD